ncbi:MAG: zinc-binding dehydrogenase, partial [Bacteroidota bacterium]
MYIQGLIHKQCKRVMVVPDSKLLGLITCLVDQNMLSPVVEETFSWKDMAKAHTLAEKGKVRGKIAIEID